jgi:hypothetical protein
MDGLQPGLMHCLLQSLPEVPAPDLPPSDHQLAVLLRQNSTGLSGRNGQKVELFGVGDDDGSAGGLQLEGGHELLTLGGLDAGGWDVHVGGMKVSISLRKIVMGVVIVVGGVG